MGNILETSNRGQDPTYKNRVEKSIPNSTAAETNILTINLRTD
jgi:hypothetical protein